MNIEEIYDLELKYQEVYDRTKDYTRNDFVIELIKKDDEKQELIEYLKEQIKEYKKELSYRYQEDHEIGLAKGYFNAYEDILSKIEKRG